MRPAFYAFLAVILYSLLNTVFEQKFAKYNTVSVMMYCYLVMLPLTISYLAWFRITNRAIASPSGVMILAALGLGLVYFLADYFFLGAYSAGGNLITITTIILLVPLTSSILKYLWIGGLPNKFQLAGYLLAAGGVFLIAKGSAG